MTRVLAVAINTFREAVRDKVLYGMVGAASAVLVFTLALGELSLDEEARVVHDIGLASISLFSVVTAIFLGSSLLYKEIERKTLYVILPKPIRRYEFLIGKFVGICLTGWIFVTLMGAILFSVMCAQHDALGLAFGVPIGCIAVSALVIWRARDRTAALVPLSAVFLACAAAAAGSAGVTLEPILCALALNLAEVAVVASVALLFSSFSTPFLTGLFTIGIWVAGRSAYEMATMKSRTLPDAIKSLLHTVSEVIPNFNLFVPGWNTLNEVGGQGGPIAYVLTSFGYAALYCSVLLFLASLIFNRRDFL